MLSHSHIGLTLGQAVNKKRFLKILYIILYIEITHIYLDNGELDYLLWNFYF